MQYTLMFSANGFSNYVEVSSDIEDPQTWAEAAARDHLDTYGPDDGGYSVFDLNGRRVAEAAVAEVDKRNPIEPMEAGVSLK